METIKAPQKRHARFHHPGVLYHVISKTAGGTFFLAPKRGIRDLCAGIVGKALHNHPGVKLYGYAFMSNHIHLIASGSSISIADFMAFVKRELSRRLGIKYNFKGPKWQKRYTSTALPTPKSQQACLKYILSQGVKENLVAHPFHWPGLHCAKHLSTGTTMPGQWLNSTAYKKAKRYQALRLNPKKIRKSAYYQPFSIPLSALPHWEKLSQQKKQIQIEKLIKEIVDEAKQKRAQTKKKVLGIKKVIATSIHQRVEPPNPPWWQQRRRQITAWASPRATETKRYLTLYYEFQTSFRSASTNFKNKVLATFPLGSWMPNSYCSPQAA